MTVREYIASTLSGLSIPPAYYEDLMVNPDDTYDHSMYLDVGRAMVSFLGGLILAPRVRTVNENGFSMQWDTDNLGKYYLWLCKRYGITPDPDVVSLLGINTIIDISDTW